MDVKTKRAADIVWPRLQAGEAMLAVLVDFKRVCDDSPYADLMTELFDIYDRAAKVIIQAKAAGITPTKEE